MSGKRARQLRKGGAAAARAYQRKRQSTHVGRLVATRVPATKKDWPGKRGRRPSWKDVRLTQLDKACEFSSDRDLMDPVELIRELKRHPQFVGPLLAAVSPVPATPDDPVDEPRKKQGRSRLQGDWVLLYLAFVMSRDPAMLSFWNRYASNPIWEVCGFAEQPDYELMRIRFIELEQHWMGVRDVGRLVIQQAVRHDPEIADFWMVDATGWQTHASLEHCCEDKKACRELLIKQGRLKPVKKKAESEDGDESRGDSAVADAEGEADDVDQLELRGRGVAKRLRRASHDAIENERHKEQAEEEPDLESIPASAIVPVDEDERFQYFDIQGHRYRSRDKTSGLRHYESGKAGRSWFGGYGMPAVAPKYGAPLAVETFAADDQEADHYDDLFNAAVAATGKTPLAITTDKGPGHPAFDEYNTRRGVATVRPFRKTNGASERADLRTDFVDEHGIPRCQHCGGETDMDGDSLGWYLDRKGDPRIRFRCLAPAAPGCQKTQSIACSEEWRLLLPLNLKQPLYHALREMHFSFERIFGHWRQRYAVYGKDTSSRLRRRGIPAQRLRAQAAILIEWFRICLRHGFVGSWRTRNTETPVDLMDKGKKRLRNVLAARRRRLLDLPYGAAAERVKLWRSKVASAPPDGHPDGDDIPF